MPTREFFETEARTHLVRGDLFSYENPVIPIKTKGRWYGSISRRVVDQGVILPDLRLCQAQFLAPYIFVALWDDGSTYDDRTIRSCAAACMAVASQQELDVLALPIFGGKGGEKYLWLMERGIFEMTDLLDEAGAHVPDRYVYVTDKEIA